MTKLAEQTKLCIDVAVPLPVRGLFSYAWHLEDEEKVKLGVRVRIPFRNRDITGYVVGIREAGEQNPSSPVGARHAVPLLKHVIEILDEEPVLSERMLALTRWISEYYGCSWGEAIENALPRWVKYGKKAERALKKEIDFSPTMEKKEDFELTPDQKQAFDLIMKSIGQAQPKPIFIYGVTGSGKSEVYIRAIREMIARKKASICLVPEIALTEQIRRFFHHHFGDDLEIVHSKLNDTERFLAWKRLECGKRKVVLGPRSAVFAPVPNLGLVIMDEEHENSYKQETVPRYHARDVARFRCQNENALLVMGSATPSLETMYATKQNDILRVDLNTRIDQRPMPRVQVVDLKHAPGLSRGRSILTPPLSVEIEKSLRKNEGILLLLNRRGYSTHIHCPACGNIEDCPFCHVSLTFHQEDGNLLCHYCNYQKDVPQVCGTCKKPLLRFSGFGTEKVESEVASLFPKAKIGRLDADSVRKKGSHEKILKDFRERKMDILIGTQMIAKGFDFPHVTLVGVILADVGLMLPDFRSSERTFQLLTQVAGRAGRGKIPGRVIIQTFSPDHPSVRFAKGHAYHQFYENEIPDRISLRYPPFSRLINVLIRSKDEKKVYLFAREIRDALKKELADLLVERNQTAPESDWVEMIGPSPLPFYKLRGHYRWHVMLKTAHGLSLVERILGCISKVRKPAAVAFALDVDPVNIL